MGCKESRCWPWSTLSDKQTEVIADKQGGQETEAFLEDVKETECSVAPEEKADDGRPPALLPVSKPILAFAQSMSEDIVAQALQLFWKVEIQYKNLPFIDNDIDYVI
ncbi:Hypothetical protein SMAX5B_006976 [Scophthalmus maximus]|uniref:Uncharacterized protein n=1 Tax=Scophthalmus maximus TaxID=52904 RepID=A0A2U9AWJ7_SCOMX|nr:Hypothetical protein SMAX5B_006976 [Scophthalmus maximus]KAF0045792.1 hypothetical protein F2P81_002321 [Scophthalmus maximus]